MKVFFMDDCSKVSRVSSATLHRALTFLSNQEQRRFLYSNSRRDKKKIYSNDLFDEIKCLGRAQMQCQQIKMQEKQPSINQHQTWMPSGFDCDVFKLVKIIQ